MWRVMKKKKESRNKNAMRGVWKRPHSNDRLSVESLMPAGTTWGLRFFLVFCSFLVLHLSLSSICSPVPSVCVSVCVCHESPCLQSHNMTERRSYQTQRGELHKWHSGARTPLENRSEGGKVRDGGREADCVYVDVLCVRGDTCFFSPPQYTPTPSLPLLCLPVLIKHLKMEMRGLSLCFIGVSQRLIITEYSRSKSRFWTVNIRSYHPVMHRAVSNSGIYIFFHI